jgi:hypothetical protein
MAISYEFVHQAGNGKKSHKHNRNSRPYDGFSQFLARTQMQVFLPFSTSFTRLPIIFHRRGGEHWKENFQQFSEWGMKNFIFWL